MHKSILLLRQLVSTGVLVAFSMIFMSCYSIRIANIKGAPEPSSLGTGETGYYADKTFTVLDTTISLKLYEHDAMFLEPCEEGGFYSVEYRVKFGDILLNAITFGTRKKVRVKYVCLKPQS